MGSCLNKIVGRFHAERAAFVLGILVGLLILFHVTATGDWTFDNDIVQVEEEQGDLKSSLTRETKVNSEQLCDSVTSGLYPEENPNSDRIVEQLAYTPCSNFSNQLTILVWGGVVNWGGIQPKNGDEVFEREECAVRNCRLTSERKELDSADLVIFRESQRPSSPTRKDKRQGQVWLWYNLESPFHASLDGRMESQLDWTATYRRDSTIVAPYAKWNPYKDVPPKEDIVSSQSGGNATKMVAWFVSNCNARNNRLQYAKELAKHIQVDIYGSCGSLKCPRRDSECMEMLKTYKFYLAFENSNCRDYVTEKLFMNALQNGVVPIVMGASVEDYAAIAPPHSFLHVDNYNSPADLANHLEILAKDEKLYNEFLEWRTQGEWLRTRFFCRVCAMLHYHQEHGPSTGVEGGWGQWWGGKGVCRAAGS